MLKCIPIKNQIEKHGAEKVYAFTIAYLDKCLTGIGIDIPDDKMKLLCEDILEVYSHDSLEDIVQCLKKGRQGYYGTSYNKLNMMVIQEWMSKHLEEKARLRENLHQSEKEKHEWETRQQYEEAVKAGEILGEKLKSMTKDDSEYQKFKADYEASQQIRKAALEKDKRK